MGEPPGDTTLALSRFLEQFPGTQRAEALHLALKALRARVEPDRVLMCELAWEIHRQGYWSQLQRDDGSPYDSEESYFREVLGLSAYTGEGEHPDRSIMNAPIGDRDRSGATLGVGG